MLKWLLAGMALCLAACSLDDSDARYYHPPQGTTAANGGTIIGSRTAEPPLVSDQTVFLRGVAGEPVKGGNGAYDRPVLVPAGKVNVTIAWNQGSLFGQITVPLTIKPNDSLVIRHQREDKERARVWFEDARTHAVVGEPLFIRLQPVQMVVEK